MPKALFSYIKENMSSYQKNKDKRLDSLRKRINEYFYLKSFFDDPSKDIDSHYLMFTRLKQLQIYFEKNIQGFPKDKVDK